MQSLSDEDNDYADAGPTAKVCFSKMIEGFMFVCKALTSNHTMFKRVLDLVTSSGCRLIHHEASADGMDPRLSAIIYESAMRPSNASKNFIKIDSREYHVKYFFPHRVFLFS